MRTVFCAREGSYENVEPFAVGSLQGIFDVLLRPGLRGGEMAIHGIKAEVFDGDWQLIVQIRRGNGRKAYANWDDVVVITEHDLV